MVFFQSSGFGAKYWNRLFISLTTLTVTVFVGGCGMKSKGLDAEIKGNTTKEFFESCYEAYLSIREANPNEFEALKGTSHAFLDTTQPKDAAAFQISGPYICKSHAESIQQAALTDNVNLKTLREIYVWRIKYEIDSDKDWKLNAEKIKDEPDYGIRKVQQEYLKATLKKIKENQTFYTVFTGKSYGPTDLVLPNLAPTAKSDQIIHTLKAGEQPVTPPAPPVPAPNPVPAKNPSTVSPQASTQPTWTPSFDCTKASIFSEKAVCTDTLLGKLDGALSQNYKYILASNIGDGGRMDLRATQKKWLSERNKCIENRCLASSYRKRIDEICGYSVISGIHPICTNSDEIE